MSNITFKGDPLTIGGSLPAIGSKVQDFKLTNNELNDVSLADFKGKTILLNIFPSIDTSVCADSVRTFNTEASNLKNTCVLCISKDLPFAQARFCGAENIKNVHTLSAFRNTTFGKEFGVDILDGPVKGLFARAVIVLSPDGKVLYTELVHELTHKPNYEAALTALEAV